MPEWTVEIERTRCDVAFIKVEAMSVGEAMQKAYAEVEDGDFEPTGHGPSEYHIEDIVCDINRELEYICSNCNTPYGTDFDPDHFDANMLPVQRCPSCLEMTTFYANEVEPE